jgi:LPS-assembly protein
MFKALVLFFLFAFSVPAGAASSFEVDSVNQKHHVTADRTLYHSREKVYEAFGHVVVSARGQRLSCDYLWLDDNTKEIKARGNVLLVQGGTMIQAAELHFSLTTGFGSIFYGKVSNDQYSLKGQLIRRVSQNRFLTTEGEYTTCKDCAESWKLSAKNVDLTIDGYAFLDSVYVKIKDVPTVYIPYLIVPVKTKRQSGLLFPRIGVNTGNHGFIFVQPYYWAIDDHQDLTVGLGRYTRRGMRFELEHRYQSYDGSGGQLNVFHTRDRNFRGLLDKQGITDRGARTAIIANNKWSVGRHLQFRWKIYETLDREYPLDFPEDIIGRQLPALESNGVVTAPFDDFFVSVEARRYRNLLYDRPIGFDTGTVQALPTAHFGLKPVRVAGPLFASFYGRFDRFSRHNGSFQDENTNGVFDVNVPDREFIREADRFIFQPELSAPFRLGNFLSVGPSLRYNELRYNFSVPTAGGEVPNTSTRYLQATLELSATMERIYEYNSQRVSRLKHQITPFVTLSNIPWLSKGDPAHPFNGGANSQIESNAGLFDQFDRVPYTNNTDFLRHPQGKSVYYGFTSRLIRKMKRPEEMAPRAYPYDLVPARPKVYPKPENRKQELALERTQLFDQFAPHYDDYQEIWTVNVSQAYDFKAAKRDPDSKRAFSYLLAKSNLNLDRFSSSIEYRFFPRISSRAIGPATGALLPEVVYSNKSFLTADFTWYLQSLTNLRRTRSFVRSLAGNFTVGSQPNPSRTARAIVNWSFNDFVSTRFDYGFDLLAKNQLDWSARLMLTHPSECWGVMANYSWLRNRGINKAEVGFQLLLNVMGTGFLGGDQIQPTASGAPAGVFGGSGYPSP